MGERYACDAFSAEALWSDLREYCLAHRLNIKSHRVCFFQKNHNRVFILELSGVDEWVVEILEDQLSSGNKLIQPTLQAIYRTVNIWCVTDRAEDLMPFFRAIKAVYAQAKIHTQTYILKPFSLMGFASSVVQLLQTGRLVQRADIYRHYQTCCQRRFEDYLSSRSDLSSAFYRVLERLFKYELLAKSSHALLSDDLSLPQLELNWQRYLQMKQKVYAQNSQITINQLPLEFMVNIAIAIKREVLIPYLQDEAQQRVQAQQAWEGQFLAQIRHQKKDWRNYSRWLGMGIFQTIYQGSLAALFGVLFTGIFKCLMRIERLAVTAEHLGARVMRRQNFRADASKVIQGLGALFGLYYTFCLGGYQVVRLLLVHLLGLRVNRYLTEKQCDDGSARLSTRVVSPINVMRMTNLLMAGAESLYTRQLRHLVYATGGTLGSAISVLHANQGTEEQMLLHFLLSMMGQQAGRLIAFYGYRGYAHFQDCLWAAERLNELAVESAREMSSEVCPLHWESHCDRSVWSWPFLFAPKQPIRFSFTTANHRFVEMQCNSVRTSDFYGVLTCQESTESATLRLSP